MLLLHIGAVHLDVDSQGSTLWHKLAPRSRLLFALLFVFATALTPNGHWLTWAVYGVSLGVLLLICRVTLPVLLRRVAIEMVFLSVVLLGTLFRDGETVLWRWGWLRITTVGLVVLGSVCLKAFLCLVMMNLLVLTTPIPALLQAFVELRSPPLLVAIMAAMYRYSGLLAEEFTVMKRAAISRNLMNRGIGNAQQRLVVGNMVGSLFIRTYERGDRIHLAMVSRGYQGLSPLTDALPMRRLDMGLLTILVFMLLAGQVIYLG